jgi:cysteine desulfurase
MITAKTEHKAVLDTCQHIEKNGGEVTYLDVQEDGVINLKELEDAMRPETILVSVMYVNNETGVIQPIKEISAITKKYGALFFTDATQAIGKMPVDVDDLDVDFLTLSGHKIYGPKGIGALYVRRNPVVGLEPMILGGGHEQGLRAGTLATHQIAGFGMAMSLAVTERESDHARLHLLREKLWQGLQRLRDVELNGHPAEHVPNILNVAFHGIEGESLLFALQELILSAGAACSTGSDEASYVLRALGRSDQVAQSSLRFSMGRFTTGQDIDIAIAAVHREVTRLRSLATGSP